mgnify:CR=1 FL=1
MDIVINKKNINLIQLQKMAFIYNALEDGWSVRKKENLYIFRKDHESKKEVYLDTFLKRFMMTNMNISKIMKEI